MQSSIDWNFQWQSHEAQFGASESVVPDQAMNYVHSGVCNREHHHSDSGRLQKHELHVIRRGIDIRSNIEVSEQTHNKSVRLRTFQGKRYSTT